MNDILSSLNKELTDAVAAAESSVVQLHGRRPVAAVAIDADLVIAPQQPCITTPSRCARPTVARSKARFSVAPPPPSPWFACLA